MVQFSDQPGGPGIITTAAVPDDTAATTVQQVNEVRPSRNMSYSPLNEDSYSDMASVATDRTSVAISDRTSAVLDHEDLDSDEGGSITPSTSAFTTVLDLSALNTGTNKSYFIFSFTLDSSNTVH